MFIIRNDNYQYVLYETKTGVLLSQNHGREGMLMDYKRLAKRYPTYMQAVMAIRGRAEGLIIEEE